MASGNTTRASIPYPLSTDTANISSDMQLLAQRVADIIPIWSSSSTPPSSPANGQIWWNTGTNNSYTYGMNYYSTDVSAWVAIGDDIRVVTADPTVGVFLNMITYNSVTHAMKYYNGTSWIDIIPQPSTAGYVYVVDSTGGSGTQWKQLPTSGVQSYYNASNSVAVLTTATTINFGTVNSITGFTKYKVDISFPVVITAAGATSLSSAITKSGGAGTVVGQFSTSVPATANNTVITVSYSGIYTGSTSEGITFGATATKVSTGTLTAGPATIIITPMAF